VRRLTIGRQRFVLPFALWLSFPAHARESYNFNTHWLYQIGEASGFEAPGFNDSGWEEVGLPHTLKLEPMRFPRHQSFYRGLGCYRRHFTLPALPAGSHVLVRFEAVMTRADVWVNGRYLGDHLGGFTPFDFDITEVFRPDQDNVIAVKVDNREMKAVPPEGGIQDYTLFGGMVRDLRLEVVPPQFIALTKIENPGLAEGRPRLAVRTWIQNFSSTPVPALVITELRDPNGKVLATVSSPSELAPQAENLVEQTSEPLPPLHLWSPEEPYLYTVTTTVQAQGEDAISTAYGFRYFTFDPDQGFFLNGRHLKLIGHNRHQMYPHLGNAVPNRYQVFDARMLKAAGANFVRLSHYPQDPAFLDACDRLGITLFAELPGWHYLGDAAWKDLAETMLRDMIKRDWNHPSVILWGVRVNESPNDLEFHTRLNRVAKELDSTRPTSGARTFMTHGEYFEDVIAVNDYSGSILPREEPKPFLVTEYGSLSYVLPPKPTEKELLRSVGWYLHILNLAGQRSWVAGTASWEFQDNNTFMPWYACLDCQDHIRDMGLVNLHRLPRPLYFFFRSQQDQEPFVYIANRWQKDSPRDVTVFGNCQEVELSLNGQVIGRQAPDASYRLPPRNGLASRGVAIITTRRVPDRKKINSTDGLPHPPFTFRDLTWEPGELSVRCYQGEMVAAEDVVRTPGEPATIQLEPDYSELVADGADLTRVVVSVRDRNGTLVPERKRMIELSAKGKGRLIGDQPLVLENGLAAVYLQAGLQPGDLELSATAGGIAPARLVITTVLSTEPTVPLPESKL
jgi:beta-galactosidase